ncbi:MAG TPA: peptide-methionine (S)-S-oxide reductase MsrA [Candidatus Didemnitutus sp.]|nr:peptide-methionine (S)-S-oxide reductase MsrA [Candidatus Didemnitutus sp.]
MKLIPTFFAVTTALLLMTPSASSAPANPPPAQTEVAVLGGGCFWCLEAVYQRLPGVIKVTSGYAGGHTVNPTYQDVCTGDTGHAEVARIEFDPKVLSYAKLLEVFFEAHDPTTLNRQGADEGTQYRSAIFYLNEEQHKVAGRAKIAAQANWEDPIVTEIVPLTHFYAAENYHQDYYNQHPNQGYCSIVIRPKVKKLQDKGVISQDPK